MYIARNKLYDIRCTVAILATWLYIFSAPCLLLWLIKSQFHITSLWLLVVAYPILLVVCFFSTRFVKHCILFPLILGKYTGRIGGKHEDAVIEIQKLFLQKQFQLQDVISLLQPIQNAYTEELCRVLARCCEGQSDWIYTKNMEPYQKQINRLMNQIVDEDFKL